MPKPGQIKYCDILGGRDTNAAFVWIPPGSFWMGDKRNRFNLVHFVTISKGFWLQQTPLTVSQYQHTGSPNSIPKGNLTWDNVVDFCQGKNLRMPTEAEWEYAARANTGHKYFNSGSNIPDNVAWTVDISDDQVHPVAKLKSNNYKLFDMSGNIHEWCQDEVAIRLHLFPQFDPISSGILGSGIGDKRIARGGSILADNKALAITLRLEVANLDIFDELGVRLVWEI